MSNPRPSCPLTSYAFVQRLASDVLGVPFVVRGDATGKGRCPRGFCSGNFIIETKQIEVSPALSGAVVCMPIPCPHLTNLRGFERPERGIDDDAVS